MKKYLTNGLLAGVITGALLMIQTGVALSAPAIVSQNLPLTSYTASGWEGQPLIPSTYSPDKAFDASATTRWRAAANATPLTPEWIEVDLGQVYDLADVLMTLYLSAQPVSATIDVYADTDPIGAANAVAANLIATFASPPAPGYTQLQNFVIATAGALPVQYVQVRTWNEHLVNSPTSYVRPSWTNIEVWAEQLSVPEPSSLILLGSGLAGLIIMRRRRG